ncbi:MAG: ABC transporter permease subunit [Dehalobacter sp. 4CP]|uniref:ABC transporter permease n=1 Tax=Dehalobacter sp. CP TaxID=2594474 RepID=UPI0013CA5F7F|nr:ABC transporter permease subunit [Dehalobacter sp. 4CP]
MWTIAKLSFKEILYKRIFLIALIMTLAYLLLYGIATHYAAASSLESLNQMNPDQKAAMSLQLKMVGSQLLSMGLFFANFIIGLLTILATVGSIAGNIESHQIDPILTRPIRRMDFVLGRYLGYGILLMGYTLFFFLAIILVNHLFGGLLQANLLFSNILKASFVFACVPLIMIAPALFFSANFGTMNSGIILIVLYGMSFIGGFVEQLGNILQNTALVNIGVVSSLLFPADTLFRYMNTLLDAGNAGSFNPASLLFGTGSPSTLMLVYCVVYVLLILLLGIQSFGRRDI